VSDCSLPDWYTLVLTTLLDNGGHVFGAVINLQNQRCSNSSRPRPRRDRDAAWRRASPREMAPADGLTLIIEYLEHPFPFGDGKVNEELRDPERVIDERGAGFSVARSRTVRAREGVAHGPERVDERCRSRPSTAHSALQAEENSLASEHRQCSPSCNVRPLALLS